MAAGRTDIRSATPCQSSRPVSTIVSMTTESACSSPSIPGRACGPLALLVLHRVGGVVGGDGVDRAVGQPGPHAPATSSSVRSGGLTLNTGS